MSKLVLEAPAGYGKLSGFREELVQHPVYKGLHCMDAVRTFMKYHVFAVWDFMSLLKALQRAVTCVEVPWVPRGEPDVRRFVNEIVLAEESDEDGRGGYLSHFELYCQAMEECGADTRPVETFLEALREGGDTRSALRRAAVPEPVRQFVEHTLTIASCGQTHRIAASFFFGREDVIPDMFRALVEDLRAEFPQLRQLIYYLDRHIEVDGDDHGPRAYSLLTALCHDDPVLLEEAAETARASMRARYALWDGVLAEI